MQLLAASSDLPEHYFATPYSALYFVVATAVMSASKNNKVTNVASVIAHDAVCVPKQLFTPVSTKDIFSAPIAALHSSLPTQCSFVGTTDNSHTRKNIANKEW